jgi:hypothetical protein
VKPSGWSDSFIFDFRTSRIPVPEFLDGIPKALRTFGDSQVAPDPLRLAGKNTFARIQNLDFPSGYNEKPYRAENVHGLFPEKDRFLATALGGVLSWVANARPFAPFKHIYTCFDARSKKLELQRQVPPGAGWHQIGDAAESLLNTLEEGLTFPVLIGRTVAPKDLTLAYNFTETITGSWIEPNEVFVTLKNDFHAYNNPLEREICTEIWVHNCEPNFFNSWGFNCNG